ncbi:MAG: SsrA-binding protein SmpB [Clostridia bacterium]|jgi:SsrA-binding protein|nr:SsrA-binding protein SmpB [Clostridia bacterium]
MAIKLVAQNKKASFDYFLEDKYEAGIELSGTEVKAIRQGKCSIKESTVRIDRKGEIHILNMHISHYEQGNRYNKDPFRPRKLLLHRREIDKLKGAMKERGYTIVATKVYFKDHLVKVEIALAKGKKNYDKRHDIAKKDQLREAEKNFKIKNL